MILFEALACLCPFICLLMPVSKSLVVENINSALRVRICCGVLRQIPGEDME
jgi:hypothetical protein